MNQQPFSGSLPSFDLLHFLAPVPVWCAWHGLKPRLPLGGLGWGWTLPGSPGWPARVGLRAAASVMSRELWLAARGRGDTFPCSVMTANQKKRVGGGHLRQELLV